MEWVCGFAMEAGRLKAVAVNEDRQRTTISLGELHRQGVPTASRTSRAKVCVNFQAFRAGSGHEYRQCFGIELPEDIRDNHQVFEFKENNNIYFVPALVLMRALFQPAILVLPDIFLNNALERACHLSWKSHDVAPELIIHASWAYPSYKHRYANWENPFRWFMAHPSATHMVDSVHQHAIEARCAMALPEAELEANINFVEYAGRRFVTNFKIISITPLDKPIHELKQLKSAIRYHDGHDNCERAQHRHDLPTIPRHADSSTDVNDDEWQIIEPLITNHLGRPTTDLRQRLNSVIGKLATGLSWKSYPYTRGTWNDASQAYRRWKKCGDLELILSVIRERRTATTE
ncbi:transposase [Derxia gummosa]|uniref:Transposase n=1 Tax=Derxia gummosa DSM 723 TaxID=1121388 RepID=A0A8B6XAJ6_9BURK|nr:transposase [Derxia gummosa]